MMSCMFFRVSMSHQMECKVRTAVSRCGGVPGVYMVAATGQILRASFLLKIACNRSMASQFLRRLNNELAIQRRAGNYIAYARRTCRTLNEWTMKMPLI